MGNALTSSLPKYNQAARIEIQTPQSEENCGTRTSLQETRETIKRTLLHLKWWSVNSIRMMSFQK
jgi:hypothetical protein